MNHLLFQNTDAGAPAPAPVPVPAPAPSPAPAAPAGAPQTTTAGTGTATGYGAEQEAAQPDPMSSILSPLILLAVMFLIFYFLLIRPQKKREKEHRNLLQELKKNDKVITIGGLHGVVERVKGDENEVVLKVDDNTKMTFSLSAIQAVIPRKSDEVDKPGAN